jgi:hypothetical protein
MVLTVQAEPPDLVSSDGVGEGQRNATLCRLAGVHLARGDSLATVEALAKSWAEKCTPPMTEDEVERTVRSLWRKHRRSSQDAEEEALLDCSIGSPSVEPCPSLPVVAPDGLPTLHPDALHGLAGDIVRAIEPETEADPAGILLSLLTGFGSAVGRGPHFIGAGDEHHANLYLCLVGPTSAGKGQAWAGARYLLRQADTAWFKKCIAKGLSSGEGLINRVRDPVIEQRPSTNKDGNITGWESIVVEAGVCDKRLLCIETEFGRTLTVSGRDGNTLAGMLW